MPVAQQSFDAGRVREFGRAAEATVTAIELILEERARLPQRLGSELLTRVRRGGVERPEGFDERRFCVRTSSPCSR